MTHRYEESPEDQARQTAELLARSSLGTGDRADRDRVPPEVIAEILARAAQLDAASPRDDDGEDNVRILHRRFRREPGDSFADRLNTLFGYVYPAGGRPSHDGEVAVALTASGFPISRPYIAALRSGQRTNPSAETAVALAEFFRVQPEYFWDRQYADRVNRDLEVLAYMRSTLRGTVDSVAAPQVRPNR